MRYKRSMQFRHADIEKMKQFVGLKSKAYEGRPFMIDEHDARMIVANLRKNEYSKFKSLYKSRPSSSFRILQDIEFERNKIKDVV